MKILVAGGAGYIGSTICNALRDNNHIPIVLDSLIKGKEEFAKQNIFYKGDIADLDILKRIISEQGHIDYVIHLAGLISVPESTVKTYEYYKENVEKSIEFFKNLNEVGIKNILFSSSASIYGNTDRIDVDENSDLKPASPYATTKFIIEKILADYCNCYNLNGIALRYFNPIGADPKLRTGSYMEKPSHVVGKLVEAYYSGDKNFTLTGVNWPTRDGSGIRDYIHVWDLAMAHVRAIEKMDDIFKNSDKKFLAMNIGRGEGVTVKELFKAFEEASGTTLKITEAPPRDGDVAGAYAVCNLANNLLGWRAEYSVKDAIKDTLKWEEKKRSN